MDLDYSDGKEIESEIEALLTEAQDLSSMTSVAHSKYHLWPVRYHLSPERSNLLRHLNFQGLRVLELGAGMGAVSRYLAENAAHLTVVEGTSQRFRALSERLRDLSNWSGTVGNIMEASFSSPFDAVVVVGALEYSELYVNTSSPKDSPFEAFLRKAKSFLKPGGVLVLAIENQLGLKYFNGAPEDHTNHPYDGLSGYSLAKTPKTFSRKKLLQLFESVGFTGIQEYYPFPDYKLPTCVLTPSFCLTEPTLATCLATHKNELYRPHWNSYLGTKAIAEAGLLHELANSFLFVASESADSSVYRNLLPTAEQYAWHYSMNRLVPVCTSFAREHGELKAYKRALKEQVHSSEVDWVAPTHETVKKGAPLRELLLRKGYFEGHDAWYTELLKFISWATQALSSPSQPEEHLKPSAVDALFTNAVLNNEASSYELFDQEWSFSDNVPHSWFILRNVLALGRDTTSLPFNSKIKTLGGLYEQLCHDLRVSPKLNRDIELESILQSTVTPESSKSLFVEALNGRMAEPLQRTIGRQSDGSLELFRSRLERLLTRFPDFLSAMDRPSTRIFLVLDERIRSAAFFRAFFQGTKDLVRTIKGLLPATYQFCENRFVKFSGPLPREGWTLVNLTIEPTEFVHEIELLFKSRNKSFSTTLEKKDRKRFRQLLRLHQSIDSISLKSSAIEAFTPRMLTTRNLLKIEVVLRTVLPQLFHHFPWKKEFQRAKGYWSQGRIRGFIAYVYTLVQRADIGVLESYQDWTKKFDTLAEKDRLQILAHIDAFQYKPKISILMPVYNTPRQWLEQAVSSVEAQLYPNWELCIADDASTSIETKSALKEFESNPRIKITYRQKNGHISQASNSALEQATGDFVAILDHDDELNETALYHVVQELNKKPYLSFLYSDEDKVDTKNRRFLPHFKTDWNPELFYSYNLITHFSVIRTELVRRVGGFRLGYEGSQDYDLFLRCIEKLEPEQICHIPFVLYHWRVLETSTSGEVSAKPYAKTTAIKALNEHFVRTGVSAKVVEGYNDCFRIKYSLPEPLPKVSAIICTRDRVDLLKTILDGLLENTDYSNTEIIIVNNQSSQKETLRYLENLRGESNIKVIDFDRDFNFAAMNNLAATYATGEYLLFLNNDLEVIKNDWLKEMLSFAAQPHVGAVGAKLLYPSGRLQHGGVILGIGGVAGHSHKGWGPHQTDFYARTHVSQCVSAVTAACLLVKKSLFDRAGGFDQEHLQVAFNDVDFCLKLREMGYFNVWTPYAELIHYESESRGSDQTPETFPRFQKETSYMKTKWGKTLKTDPFYSPNLTLERENFDFAYPPRVEKPWHGYFRKNITDTSSHI